MKPSEILGIHDPPPPSPSMNKFKRKFANIYKSNTLVLQTTSDEKLFSVFC